MYMYKCRTYKFSTWNQEKFEDRVTEIFFFLSHCFRYLEIVLQIRWSEDKNLLDQWDRASVGNMLLTISNCYVGSMKQFFAKTRNMYLYFSINAHTFR